ncbi:MAG: hypothetical protein MR763_08875, partial [Clostridiales bacterium]|nr:hypothetical protein [Clostridiales bacterium]
MISIDNWGIPPGKTLIGMMQQFDKLVFVGMMTGKYLPPGAARRAANQNYNDCQWQSYHNSIGGPRSGG